MTLAVPNITSAFQQLGSALKLPSLGPTGGATTPAMPVMAAPTPATPVPKPATPVSSSAGLNYQIQSGDTLSGIASKYGTSVAALMAANPSITNANLIRAGSALSIPGAKTPALPSLSQSGGANYVPPNATSTVTGKPTYMPLPNPPVTAKANSTPSAPTAAPAAPATPSLPTGATSATDQGTTPPVPPAPTGTYASAPTTPAVPSLTDLIGQYLGTLTPGDQELAAISQLNNLNAGTAQAYTNTQGQPIPLPFITGQQAALQRENATLAAPLESEINTLSGIRSGKQQGLGTVIGLTTPVPTSYGGTLSRLNPQTGQYETVVNPFGTASGTASGTDTGNTTDVIGQAIAQGRLTADQVTRYGIPFLAATLKADPGYNFVTQKASTSANSTSLTQQQTYLDTITRSFNTAKDNLNSLLQYMNSSGAVNTSTIPLINTLQNRVKAGALDPGVVAGYQAAIAGLRAEYAQVLARGGEVTDSARNQAASLIPDNLTPAQLQQVADRLNTEGNNAVSEATKNVQQIVTRIGSNPGGSGGAFSNTGSSSSNPFSSANFFGQ